MSLEKNPLFLKQKFNLQAAPEVEAAAKRSRAKGREVKETAQGRIQNYLDRFGEILNLKDAQKRERGIEAIKRILHRDHIIDPQTATDQYVKRQKKVAREQGHGDVDVPASLQREIQSAVKRVVAGEKAEMVLRKMPNEQKQMVEEIVALVEEQKNSLDVWVDYLSSPDAPYPDWLKYWAIRNVLSLGKYDKDKKLFPKRVDTTTNPFPDLNREALAYVLDALLQKNDGKKIDLDRLEADDRAWVGQLLASENFAKLYAWAMEKITPASKELLTITEGKWTRYPKGSDHMPLVQSLQKRSTGWCTAGESTAQSQLSRGDFYVYYSLDEQGKPMIPRAAIRMEGEGIAEVRGIAQEQNLDPFIAPVVAEKMKEFPDGKAYEKKAADMKRVTAIEHKDRLGQSLAKDDLIFLYEINGKIEGFGYGDSRDPRIAELRSKRNPKEDAPIVMECEPNEIAWRKEDVNENTKAYIGPLFNDIFKALGHLEHFYTSFPEGKITRYNVQIGGQSEKQLEDALKRAGFQIGDYALQMMQNKDFQTAKEVEQNDLVRLSVQDLFHDQQAHTTDEVYKRAEKFGLELCPAEVGPHLRLKLADQPMGDWFYIAMKQIADADGGPSVFRVSRDVGGLWLNGRWAGPARLWDPAGQFVFRLRK